MSELNYDSEVDTNYDPATGRCYIRIINTPLWGQGDIKPWLYDDHNTVIALAWTDTDRDGSVEGSISDSGYVVPERYRLDYSVRPFPSDQQVEQANYNAASDYINKKMTTGN